MIGQYLIFKSNICHYHRDIIKLFTTQRESSDRFLGLVLVTNVIRFFSNFCMADTCSGQFESPDGGTVLLVSRSERQQVVEGESLNTEGPQPTLGHAPALRPGVGADVHGDPLDYGGRLDDQLGLSCKSVITASILTLTLTHLHCPPHRRDVRG